MISREDLRNRVAVRKRQLDDRNAELIEIKSKLTDFVDDIKSRSVIYNLLKNLTVWKEIENLINFDQTHS